MSAAITDLLTQATISSRPVPTQVTSPRTAGVTTLSCNALTGWPTGTAVHFCTYKIDTSGNKIAGSQIDMKGVVSGTTLTQILIKAGTDVGNAVGDIVEAAPTAAWANDLVTWGTAHANQDGSLLQAPVITAIGTGGITGANLSTSAIKLGSAKITTGFSSTATAYTAITGLSVSAVVPAGGRDLEITFNGSASSSAVAGNNFTIDIYDSTNSVEVGGSGALSIPTSSYALNASFTCELTAPSAGTHVYIARFTQSAAGTFFLNASTTMPASLTVKVI